MVKLAAAYLVSISPLVSTMYRIGVEFEYVGHSLRIGSEQSFPFPVQLVRVSVERSLNSGVEHYRKQQEQTEQLEIG